MIARLISAEMVRKNLSYNPETGEFVWLPRDYAPFNAKFVGKPALTALCGGYRKGSFFGNEYYAHRLAWLHYYGHWPTGEIDHINGDRADNRIANLRDVSRGENCRNTGIAKDNTSGIVGVIYLKESGRWGAQIRANGVNNWLGCFSAKEEAAKARAKAAVEYGFHPNHGRPAR